MARGGTAAQFQLNQNVSHHSAQGVSGPVEEDHAEPEVQDEDGHEREHNRGRCALADPLGAAVGRRAPPAAALCVAGWRKTNQGGSERHSPARSPTSGLCLDVRVSLRADKNRGRTRRRKGRATDLITAMEKAKTADLITIAMISKGTSALTADSIITLAEMPVRGVVFVCPSLN